MTPFSPVLDGLSAPQRRLLDEFRGLPGDFVLYGGTALALRLGHRTSADFDFFSHARLDRPALTRALRWLGSAAVLDETPQGLTVSVDRDGPVKVSFFGGIDFGRVAAPELLPGTFNPLVARKALAYFEGGDLDRLDAELRARLTRAALADVEPTPLGRLSAELLG